MRVVVAGGTGFLGRSLVARLGAAGHEVVILTDPSSPIASPACRVESRRPAGLWSTETTAPTPSSIWLAKTSRVDGNPKDRSSTKPHPEHQSLAAVRRAALKPPVFLNTSAVDCSDTGDEPSTILSSDPTSLRPCASIGKREATRWRPWDAVIVRSGLVLATRGGVLERETALLRGRST
jgi:NAD dependent epimerase/dehydratase family enzyme